MALQWEQLIIDAADHAELGRWWARALDWVVVADNDEEFEIRPEPHRLPGILFTPVADEKTVKNRLHLDLRPDDQSREVARLVALGARHVDIGQRDEPWVVLADPEGNEFCVLGPRRN
ncbi:VOC family protein [Streptomyces paradoxus]|uniref:VOC family protein n=1 Tax=Streptomyces paradoxus TaxID=66375 RepID=UPI00363B66EC